MDNEQDLDPEALITTFSFGARRNLIFRHNEFQKNPFSPVKHGSQHVQKSPTKTNKMWKHSIPAEPEV